MKIARRAFVAAGATLVAAMKCAPVAFAQPGGEMYGLIGKLTVAEGKRDELIAILLESVANMPGCLSYVVAKDTSEPNAIWVTEVWKSKESHDASLLLPAVKEAIGKGRPLIAGFSDRVVTTPVGGHGLTLPNG